MEEHDIKQTSFNPNELDSLKRQQHKQDHVRIALCVFSITYSLLYTGAFFGWGPMQLLLEDNGAFHSACDPSDEKEDIVCESQTIKLLNVHMIAQFNLILAPLFGYISDIYGPMKAAYIMIGPGILGMSLLILATSQHIDNLIYVAFFFIGTMSVASSSLVVQTYMLFPETGQFLTRQLVCSGLNTFFDAGSVTYLGLWAIKEYTTAGANNLSLEAVLGGYLGLGVIIFGATIFLWSMIHLEIPMAIHIETKEIVDDYENQIDGSSPHISSSMEQSSLDENGDNISIQHVSKVTRKYILIADRSTYEQLKSSQHLYLVFFYTIHVAKDVFILTATRDILAFLGDDETGNRYLSIFSLLMPVSIIGVPFVDYVLRHYGHYGGLQLVNLLGVIHGIITVATPNMNIQVVGFIIFSFYRCFLFTVAFSFGPTFLSGDVVGRSAGFMVFSSGIFSFLNIVLKNWAINNLGGNFIGPNGLYLALMAPCIYVAWRMGEGIKLEARVKQGTWDNS